MATTIVTKNSSTASAVPTAAQLVQGELAVNVADKRIYTENNAGAVVELGTNPSTLTVAGEITANGGIALGDNDKATFGASDDLQIYHDGFNTLIKESGAGSLLIDATNTYFRNAAGTKDYAWMVDGGAVSLFHNNALKLATTATGIDVTGTVTADGLDVRTTSSPARIKVQRDDNTNSVDSASIDLLEGTGINADFGALGSFGYRLEVDGSTNKFNIKSGNGASVANRLSVERDTGNISFYEDTGTTAKFFWDASAEKLNLTGVGGLDVTGTATLDGLDIEGAGAGLANFYRASANANFSAITFKDTTNTNINAKIGWNANELRLDGTNSVRLVTDAKNRLLVSLGGDISFYEDTGITPKMVWNASFERLSIDSNTVNPLVISRNGGTDANVSIKFDCATSDYYVGTNPANNFGIGISSDLTSAPFQITSTGNVGVGITPTTPFHVYNATLDTVATFQSGDPAIAVNFVASDNSMQLATSGTDGLLKNNGAGNLRLFNNGSERMRITSAGNVGIGTTSPSRPLDVRTGAFNSAVAQFTGANDGRGLLISTFARGSNDDSVDYDTPFNGHHTFSTANIERFRIDANGNVGIGTITPSTHLDVAGGTTNQVAIFRSSDATATIGFADNTTPLTGNLSYVTVGAVGNNMVFNTNLVEAMRIDSAGNVLVGKTNTTLGTVGIENRPDGRFTSTRSGNVNLTLNRLVSDGSLIDFYKDGATIGSIGSYLGSLVIDAPNNGSALILEGSNTSGTTTRLAMSNEGGLEAFRPFNGESDALFDLGSSTRRFKDLYLSGGVYLGGTGAANKLDDYEEGTWTPALGGTWTTNPTSLSGTYTKVGNVVTIRMKMTGGVKSSAVSGYITGLPFATNNSYGSAGSVTNSVVSDFGNCLFQNTDRIWLTETNLGTGTVYVSGVYETTA